MNKYRQIGDKTVLSDAATDRIYKNLIAANHAHKRQKVEKNMWASNRVFKLSAICASAAIICGAAISTGIYLGNRGDNGKYGNASDGESEIYLYYLDSRFEKNEYDLDNVEITVSYGFKEEDLRGIYENRVKAGENEFGEIFKFEINLVAQSMAPDNSVYKRHNCNSIQVDNIDEFPFEKYDYEVIGYDESCNKPNNISYQYCEKVLLPSELFILDGNEHRVYIYLYERVEYSQGFNVERRESYLLHPESFFVDGFMSVDGKISGYNQFTAGGFVSGFYYGEENEHAVFVYKYIPELNKIVINS